jgi:MFS family permease
MNGQAVSKSVAAHILKERNIQWYFGTQIFSLTGLMLRSSVTSLLIIHLVGVEKAPPLVGAVWALNVLPGAFFGVLAGLFMDRYDKRNVLQVTAVLGVIQALMLAYISHKGTPHAVNLVLWVMLFTGFTNALDGLGRNAIVKDAVLPQSDPLVARKNQRAAGIIFSSLYTFGLLVGNGLAGYLVVWIGYTPTFLLNGASFILLIFGLSKMDFSHVKHTVNWKWSEIGGKIAENFRFALHEPGIRLCILLLAVVTLFGYAYNVILPIIAKVMFHGGPKEYSYLAAMGGVGSLAGALLAIFKGEKHPLRFLVGGCFAMGLSQIAASQATSIHVAACMFMLSGFGFMVSFLPSRGTLMHIVPRERMGIVLGFMFTCFYAGMMLSSFGAGYIAKHFGSETVLVLCGAALLLVGTISPFLPGIKELE